MDLQEKVNQKLKVLAFGDIHGDSLKAKELAEQAERENVDLVIICGDISNSETQLENIIGIFKDKNLKVLLIPGNHESMASADFLAELYNFKNLHGYTYKINNIGFFGCGSANIGLFQLPENEIQNILEKGANYTKDCKKRIMVTHVHPADSKMEKFSDFIQGSTGVKNIINKHQPDILLCSHVHEAEGIEELIGKTRVINVGKQGKILEL